ncbi:hypothetical protein C5167_019247 [Papaver somniferum]|uniref:Uncharacterized protein n=1 Tax=Papaver somniferum TaxID=3469 RepID=A0A4Y7IPM2_PAPSO|nr:hypothetical protein C5167_019247 [Papaver somniferum]
MAVNKLNLPELMADDSTGSMHSGCSLLSLLYNFVLVLDLSIDRVWNFFTNPTVSVHG